MLEYTAKLWLSYNPFSCFCSVVQDNSRLFLVVLFCAWICCKGYHAYFSGKATRLKRATFRFEQISAGLSRTLQKVADFSPGKTMNDLERP
jgi:Tfp pilus assembly protein PilO